MSFSLLCSRKDTDLSEGSQLKRYVNAKTPEDLMKEIAKLIKQKKLGYRGRAEFAVEACRERNSPNKGKLIIST